MIAEGNSVERWHTQGWPVKQTVAAHSWGVAMLLLERAPERVVDKGLLKAALTHDLHESILGDIPWGVREEFSDLGALIDEAADLVDREMGVKVELSEEQMGWLRWADAEEARRWTAWVYDVFGFPEAGRISAQLGPRVHRLWMEASRLRRE